MNNAVEQMKRRMKFAWAKYYESNRENHDIIWDYHDRLQRLTRLTTEQSNTLPTHIKQEIEEMAEAMRKSYECPICMDMIQKGELEITNCGHKYCKACLEQLVKSHDPKCAICRKKMKGDER